MEIEQAMKILHPDTTLQALAEVEYYAGFRQGATLEACDEACVAVCDEIERLRAENNIFTQSVGQNTSSALTYKDIKTNFCPNCGRELEDK